MYGIGIRYVQHFQAMLEREVQVSLLTESLSLICNGRNLGHKESILSIV